MSSERKKEKEREREREREREDQHNREDRQYLIQLLVKGLGRVDWNRGWERF
jgi:hypothetical protein